MNILFVDLEREWRGGQSQAFLTLVGLKSNGHEVLLIAPSNAPLAERAAATGISLRPVPQLGMRIWAAFAIRSSLKQSSFDLIHVNEPHALTAAWFARAHRQHPIVLSRRIGFPLKKTWIARARYGSLTRFLANCNDVRDSLQHSGVAPERIAIVNEGVEIPEPATIAQKKNRAGKMGRKTQRVFIRLRWRVCSRERAAPLDLRPGNSSRAIPTSAFDPRRRWRFSR